MGYPLSILYTSKTTKRSGTPPLRFFTTLF